MEVRTLGRHSVRAAALAAMVSGLLVLGTSPAFAAGFAPAAHAGNGGTHGGGKGGGGTHGGNGGGTTSTPSGNDVSYPQCGTSLPSSPAFGIVGVNGGLASDLNPCLGPSPSYPSYAQSELYWTVSASTGAATPQPKASLYVNTADPGNEYGGTLITDWPTSSLATDPYGTCTTVLVATSAGPAIVGENSTACAWQYGYDKATQDRKWLSGAASAIDATSPPVTVPGTASSYPWWLDVETANTWQSGTPGQEMNVADLEGMVAALRAAGATAVGIYSTSSQWSQITGGAVAPSSSLSTLPDWVPGARTLSGAEGNCTQTPFTGGGVSITQWTTHRLDYDYAC